MEEITKKLCQNIERIVDRGFAPIKRELGLIREELQEEKYHVSDEILSTTTNGTTSMTGNDLFNGAEREFTRKSKEQGDRGGTSYAGSNRGGFVGSGYFHGGLKERGRAFVKGGSEACGSGGGPGIFADEGDESGRGKEGVFAGGRQGDFGGGFTGRPNDFGRSKSCRSGGFASKPMRDILEMSGAGGNGSGSVKVKLADGIGFLEGGIGLDGCGGGSGRIHKRGGAGSCGSGGGSSKCHCFVDLHDFGGGGSHGGRDCHIGEIGEQKGGLFEGGTGCGSGGGPGVSVVRFCGGAGNCAEGRARWRRTRLPEVESCARSCTIVLEKQSI